MSVNNYNYDLTYNKKKKLNILVVDNNIVSSSLFRNILQSRGHNVKSLTDGISCISNCKDNQYDIIFLDNQISDINVDEIADLLKDVYKSKSLIFAYSGKNNMNDMLINILMNNLENLNKINDDEKKNKLIKDISKKFNESLILF